MGAYVHGYKDAPEPSHTPLRRNAEVVTAIPILIASLEASCKIHLIGVAVHFESSASKKPTASEIPTLIGSCLAPGPCLTSSKRWTSDTPTDRGT